MRRVIAIRPEPGLSATLDAGREAGLDMAGFPLFEIRPVDWTAPASSEVDGLLIGSANAVRHAGPQLQQFLARPVFAVGEMTATRAEQAGFKVALTGSGGLQQVIDSLQGQSLRLLRLCGEQHVALDVPQGVTLLPRVVYQSAAVPMPARLAEMLVEGPVVLLHSGEAARHFAAECDRLAIDRYRIRLAALGQRIAMAAGPGWADCAVASATSESALLALARDMCQ